MDRKPALRQRLSQLYAEMGRILDGLDTHHPVLRAWVYRTRVRCGRPSCHCAKGSLHPRWVIGYQVGGQAKTRMLQDRQVQQLLELAARYRQLRHGRARLGRTFRHLLAVLDQLERSLRVAPSRVVPRYRSGSRTR